MRLPDYWQAEEVKEEIEYFLDPDFVELLLDAETEADFENLSQGADGVIKYLKRNHLHPLKGKQADGRRYMCAVICDRIWAKVHDKHQPYSTKLHAAMEEYWLACGQTSAAGIDWEKVLTGH